MVDINQHQKEREMAEELKRVEREFQMVKQSSSDIVDEEGARKHVRLANYAEAKILPFFIHPSIVHVCLHAQRPLQLW